MIFNFNGKYLDKANQICCLNAIINMQFVSCLGGEFSFLTKEDPQSALRKQDKIMTDHENNLQLNCV